jgi:hypothetical protein
VVGFLDAARSGKVGRFEASVATGATTVSWWDVVITPILDANGEPEISRDISHTKQLEAQLRYLAESGEVLGSFHVAFDGTISWISAGAQALFGCLPDELRGGDFASLVHPQDP